MQDVQLQMKPAPMNYRDHTFRGILQMLLSKATYSNISLWYIKIRIVQV